MSYLSTLNIYNLHFIPTKNNTQINTVCFLYIREITTVNYKLRKVWFTVSITPEFFIMMDTDRLIEWIEHTLGRETGDVSVSIIDPF